MHTAKLFKNGQSQAVRLPKDCRFSGIREVEVRKVGYAVLLMPPTYSLGRLVDAIKGFPDLSRYQKDPPDFRAKKLFK